MSNSKGQDENVWQVKIPPPEDLIQEQGYIEEHERKLNEFRLLEKAIRKQRRLLKRYRGLSRGSQDFMEQQEILEDLERRLTKLDINTDKSAPEFWRLKKNIKFADKPHGGKRTYRRRGRGRQTVRRRRLL